MKRPLKVLIVEDEAIIAMGMQMELEQAGFEVCQIVATGEEAIACVADNPPDLALIDDRLAGKMDGVEAARVILARQPLPIIFMTGFAVEDIRVRAQELNPLGYLIKPVRIFELETMIDSISKD
jgi:DNA-binding response OmpR family regulator